MVRVSSRSSLLGFKLPDGWLWHSISPVAPKSSAFCIIFRTSTMVLVRLPVPMHWVSRREEALLRKMVQNCSCWSSANRLCISSMTSSTLPIFFFSSTNAARRRRPSSKAACRVTAFTLPMPLMRVSSSTLISERRFRLLPLAARMRLARSTADSCDVPVRSRMASSSASPKWSAPWVRYFSRGRSETDHSGMERLGR